MSKDISRPRPRNTVDREAFRDMCRAFAQREIGPRWQKADADKQFPRDFYVAAQQAGHLAREIYAVTIPQKKGDALVVDTDEHPRATSLEVLAKLNPIVRPDGTVTAGNASGVNDGACALLLADEATAARQGRRRVPASSAWPRPVWHRASWASVRHRRRKKCWP